MKKSVKFLVSMLLAFTFILPAVVANAENVVLKQGATGDGVLLLQKKLLDLGYYQGNLDGVFGQGTYKAVTGFQSDN
ncbi:MAG: peptidoglycan-binding domain-containing protein, partial [Desulfotomaculaceae bacterium]|nr:peptidoglycan-binding domain-containing protein [Desulfotomaculaceae bacterium]